MLLTAIFNILKKNEPYNSDLYIKADLNPKFDNLSLDHAIRLLYANGYAVSPPG